jgi:hypothetical protein
MFNIFKKKHGHDYLPVAVDYQNLKFRSTDNDKLWSTKKSTIVLWRCDCGDFFSESILGKFTLKEITGIPSEPNPLKNHRAK